MNILYSANYNLIYIFANLNISFFQDYFFAFSGSWCATVPESWINNDEKIITWPHKKINATLACKKKFVPKADWETFKYDKLLGLYGKFLCCLWVKSNL